MFIFYVNGREHARDVNAVKPLLWVLREDLELTGTKYGCGVATCGACTVLTEANLPKCGAGRGAIGPRSARRRVNGVLPGSPPGARNWRLAPANMGWGGLAAYEICLRLKGTGGQDDGGKSLSAALDHVLAPGKVDPLVEWGWNPGPRAGIRHDHTVHRDPAVVEGRPWHRLPAARGRVSGQAR